MYFRLRTRGHFHLCVYVARWLPEISWDRNGRRLVYRRVLACRCYTLDHLGLPRSSVSFQEIGQRIAIGRSEGFDEGDECMWSTSNQDHQQLSDFIIFRILVQDVFCVIFREDAFLSQVLNYFFCGSFGDKSYEILGQRPSVTCVHEETSRKTERKGMNLTFYACPVQSANQFMVVLTFLCLICQSFYRFYYP